MTTTTIDNDFDIPEEYITETQEAMVGGGVQLPFPVVYFWWVNGDRREAKDGGIPYFGGWACDFEKMNEVASSTSNLIPEVLENVQLVNSEGIFYDAFVARYLSIAPIGIRRRWRTDRVSGYSRSHLQVLSYLGVYNQESEVYLPWGACVLTAKGLSSQAVEKAINDFGSKTASPRNEFANKLPAWYFYAALGTFGEEPVFKEVGSAHKNTITPCSVFVPEQIAADTLKKWFIGKDVATIVHGLRQDAQEWLTAWDKDEEEEEVKPRDFGQNQQPNQQQSAPEYDSSMPPF